MRDKLSIFDKGANGLITAEDGQAEAVQAADEAAEAVQSANDVSAAHMEYEGLEAVRAIYNEAKKDANARELREIEMHNSQMDAQLQLTNGMSNITEALQTICNQLSDIVTAITNHPSEKCELLEEIKNLNAIYRLYEMLERKGGGSETD